MSPRPTPEARRAHRAHVRQVIADHAPAGEAREGRRAPTSPEEEARLRTWYRTMFDEGLTGAGWPVEWGGRPDHHPLDSVVTTEELIRARAPRPLDQVQLASHVILLFGTPAQRDRFLPRIRSADDVWCQLFSEPGAGSDLAGITAPGTRDDDGSFTLRGHKTWTTDGHWADMGLALVRTDPGAERHRGITAFAVPMRHPGVDVRPITTIGGVAEFNEVFLDDVVLGPDAVIGDVDAGWRIAMSGLEVERFGVGGDVALLSRLLDDLVDLAGHLGADGRRALDETDVRVALADLAADARAAAAFVHDHIERAELGQPSEGDAAIAKILHSETYHRIAAYGRRLLGDFTLADTEPARVAAQRITDAWLWARALTISGGSSEIMRNVIAKRRLGLPSS